MLWSFRGKITSAKEKISEMGESGSARKPLPGTLKQATSFGIALSILVSAHGCVVLSLARLSTLYTYEAEEGGPCRLGPLWAPSEFRKSTSRVRPCLKT